LAAIVFTDIVGFSKLTEGDEVTALELLATQKQIVQPLVQEFGGQWLKEMGDGLLLSFPSSYDAVRCAICIQKAVGESNTLYCASGFTRATWCRRRPMYLAAA